jgi:hypothetical protein
MIKYFMNSARSRLAPLLYESFRFSNLSDSRLLILTVPVNFLMLNLGLALDCCQIWHLVLLTLASPSDKGAGTLLHVLHVCYSFCQKCSKPGTHTTQGLKNNFYLKCFSISSGPKPRITDEYLQFFRFLN